MWTYTQDECSTRAADLEFPATVVYEICNFNTDAFTPNQQINFIKLAPNRRLDDESIIEDVDWDSPMAPGSCRRHTEEVMFKPCQNRWRGIAIQMDGDLSRPFPRYCRCFLREYVLSEITSTPVTPAPVPGPNIRPSPVYVPGVPNPAPAPTCIFENVIITELASPDDAYAKYIELYFLDKRCAGKTIDIDLRVIRFPSGLSEFSNLLIDLKDKIVRDDGFLTICNSKQAEDYYGPKECTMFGGMISPANLQGTESIAIVSERSDGKVNNNPYPMIDIFGIPGTYADKDSKQYFVNGRAVRKIDVWYPVSEYDYNDWHVFPKCGQEVGPEGMDINEWKDVQGPICNLPTILITEIVDLDSDSYTKVPRYVELYAPRMRDRGEGFDVDLKLVIFHSDDEEPHWPSAVPIDFMPESGFLVVCNRAAYEAYGDECGETSFDLAGPANSNGDDQIALISGDESGWFVVDIYGVIGEDGWGKDI